MRQLKLLLIALTFSLPAQASEDFWNALKEGGKVILMQHSKTDDLGGDPFILDETCFTEHNLSDEGRELAKKIGKEFQQNKIQLDAVWASPYCRTKETAELAFGKYEIKDLLRVSHGLSETKASENTEKLKQLIGSYKGKGNLMIVFHRPNIANIIYERSDPGFVAVVEPLGDDMYELITTKMFE